jgi:glycosyltransferase involved in cell wall biosynthesis
MTSGPCELMIVVPSFEVGGTERQVVLLIRGLVELDPSWAKRLVVVTMRSGGALINELPTSIEVVSLCLRRVDDPRAPLLMRRLVRKRRPAAVYSFLLPANLAAGMALLGTRRRLVWGHRSERLTVGQSRARERASISLLRLLSPRVGAVIVNSSAAAGFFSGFRSLHRRVHIVPNAVDRDRFRPRPTQRRETRAGLGLANADPLVLSVGRLVQEKDHPTLLRAFALLRERKPLAHLVLAGGGAPSNRHALEELALELSIADAVMFLGERSDIEMLYCAADLVVQSSSSEGYSNVLTEAIASGVSCVSTNCGNSAELLPSSRVVPVGDAAGLATAALGALGGTDESQSSSADGLEPSVLAQRTLDVIFHGCVAPRDCRAEV